MKHILSYMRRAIEDYDMIEDGDKIAVALSGGKDSITMLKALKSLQFFYPKKFELIAISVNPGFEFFDADFLRKMSSGVYIVNPDIVFKGTKNKRMNILNQYSQATRIEMTDEEKLNNILDSIKQLEAKAKVLEQNIKTQKKRA